ncbi:MAG: hypothetical protein KGI54_15330 [Pseudomonadota bacterium]|nr:hypothetical protein [Pseudomonadota bacterium]
MNDRISCFLTDSDDARLLDAADTASAMYDVALEQHTDYLLEECKQAAYCERLIMDYEMIEGCAAIIAEIANWSGRSDEANERMKRLHVLLAQALGEVAKIEVEA